jgi:hypothetical protein
MPPVTPAGALLGRDSEMALLTTLVAPTRPPARARRRRGRKVVGLTDEALGRLARDRRARDRSRRHRCPDTAEVQPELATVRTEQESRPMVGAPDNLRRPSDQAHPAANRV